ncbi:hypothetical protein PLESTB_001138000 [Pleodorina starrii]|uniref:Uncharacterized protein n=1 Tax=Pleodorina starrii TaxID=330485 RepID=A0A9W6F5Q3_9CHLO|nr:hypothetical protein PLESTB_001138000 [Pleodorina starrii]
MQWLPCGASIHDATVTTARFGHSAVCISGTGSVWGTDLVVVFGGVSYSDGESALEHHTALADVTVLQAEADIWFAPQVSPATPEGGLPEPRAFHCAAAVDRRMYVFGGHVMSYDSVMNKKRRRFFNDLWCLDTDTWSWQNLGPGPVFSSELPPRRDMASLTRAGASCLLLFGGRLESGRVAGDAWLLDTNTHTWSPLRMPGPAPPPRKMHSAVYHELSNRVVVFGGERDSGMLDDLWTLKGVDGSEAAKWTQIKLRPAPSGRFGHAMAAYGSRLAVFGGCVNHSSLLSFSRTYLQCNELWVLDMATFSWHRVESPEGATTFSGSALEDPSLLPLLQQQAAAAAEAAQQGEGHQPPSQHHQQPQPQSALLPLPQERMCHSLLPVGSEGRLLLVGGRKRDGICADAWWLAMGPDNLTPVLTAPRPETLATALLAVYANRPRAHPPPAPTGPTGPAAAAGTAAPSPPPPPPPAAAASAPAAPLAAPPSPQGPLIANPTLLANLLRRSAPPPPAATAAGGAAGADGADGRQHHPPPQLVPPASSGRPAGGVTAASAAGGGGGGSLSSSSGSALDAAAASALVPVPASYPVPEPGGGMASSRSWGSLPAAPVDASTLGTTTTAGGGGGGSTSGGQQQGQGQGQQGQGQQGGGRERIADKASLAFNRLTKQVSTLLSKDATATATPAAAAAAAAGGSGGGSGGGQLSTSPTGGGAGGGGGILSRLLDGSVNRGGQAAAAAPPPQTPYHPPAGAEGSKLSPTSPSGPATSSPSSPSPSSSSDLRGPLERLRAGLGLPPLPSTSATTSARVSAAALGPDDAATPCADPASALAALGRRLAADNTTTTTTTATTTRNDNGGGGGGGVDAGWAVSCARAHLASSNPERLTVGQLGLVLADCQTLLKARATLGWERLEQEEQLAARQRSGDSGGGGSGGGGGGASADPVSLSWLVASHSHWLAGVRPEELRLGEVARVMAAYGELLAGAGAGAEVGASGGR